MSPQIIPLKGRKICGDRAEFWRQRLFAFELRRWGNAARASCGRDLQQAPPLAIERHGCRARIGPRFLPIQIELPASADIGLRKE
jgi:hypothetical protein